MAFHKLPCDLIEKVISDLLAGVVPKMIEIRYSISQASVSKIKKKYLSLILIRNDTPVEEVKHYNQFTKPRP